MKKHEKAPKVISHCKADDKTLIKGPANAKDCFDVLGSYTGLAKDGSRPVQDADDL